MVRGLFKSARFPTPLSRLAIPPDCVNCPFAPPIELAPSRAPRSPCRPPFSCGFVAVVLPVFDRDVPPFVVVVEPVVPVVLPVLVPVVPVSRPLRDAGFTVDVQHLNTVMEVMGIP